MGEMIIEFDFKPDSNPEWVVLFTNLGLLHFFIYHPFGFFVGAGRFFYNHFIPNEILKKFQNQRTIPTSKFKNRWSLFLNRLKGFTEMNRGFTEKHRGKKNRKYQFRVRQGGMPHCLLAIPFWGIDNIFSESKIWAFLEGCYDPQFSILPQYTKPRMGEMIIASN